MLWHAQPRVVGESFGHVADSFIRSYTHRQESLANAKVSTRKPWYIGRNSLNRPLFGIAYRNINVIYKSLKSTFSA